MAHLRLSRVNIEHLQWQNCISKYDRKHTVFYLDPPYFNTIGYGQEDDWDMFEEMKDILSKIKGKFILSHTDHPDILSLFSEYKIKKVQLSHTVCGGGGVKRTELIISNY